MTASSKKIFVSKVLSLGCVLQRQSRASVPVFFESQPFFLGLGKTLCFTIPWPLSGSAAAVCVWLPPSRAAPILADQAMSRGGPIACNGEGAGAQPLTWPRQDYIAPLE